MNFLHGKTVINVKLSYYVYNEDKKKIRCKPHFEQQIRQKKLESKNTPKKVRVQPNNPRHRNPFSPRFRPS